MTKLLKARQAAEHLNTSIWKLRQLTREGKIAYLPGKGKGAWRWHIDDLDKLIESEKVTFTNGRRNGKNKTQTK